MPLIDRDGWYKKHAVTTAARLVEVGLPKGGTSGDWAYQSVTADVLDPDTGETVRVTTDVLATYGRAWRAGQEVKVRWSAKRRTFRVWSSSTVPEEEFRAALNAPSGLSADAIRQVVSVVEASGGSEAPVEDRLAKLERLHEAGLLSAEEYAAQRARILDSL